MQEYVQKSISTTFPWSEPSESGRSPGVLSQSEMRLKAGARP